MSLTTALLLLALVAAAASSDGEWPQWRGPARNGVAPAGGYPIEWSATTNVLWKTSIEGRGHSSPIIWGNRIFLTTDVEGEVIPGAGAPVHVRDGGTYLHPQSEGADRRHRLEVIALDTVSGELLWSRTAHDGPVFDNRNRSNTYASPTPSSDGERIFAYFGSQGVFAYDFDGERVWKVDLGPIRTWGHGHGTSPLLFEGKLVLQVDQNEGDGSFLVALDAATGREVWRTARRERINYSSPILVETRQGVMQLVTSSYDVVISYDPATGEERWRSEGFVGNAVPTPVATRDVVIVASGYPDKLVRAIRIPAPGEKAGEVVWEYRKGTGYVPSPLLHWGYLYLVSDKGILTCLEPETGRVVYEGGRVPVPSFFRASPVAWEDRILIGSEEGDYFVVQAGANHRVLAHNTIEERVIASPALAHGRIYLRGEKHLYAIGHR
jgi:outer membrane protein assembly factor BamB